MKRSEANIQWCETHLRIPEGRFVGQPLKMAEFMKDDFRAIFDNPNGTRRAIISRGRKNAKTVETAMLMLLYLCGPEAKPNSQLYSAAQSREQASVLFNLAAKMVRMSPDLSQYVTIRDTAKELFCGELGTKYRALSAEASTAYGLSPRFIAHDELGQVRGPRSALYDALETATAAQDDPLSVIISTQAPTDADLLSVLIEDAKTGQDRRTILRFDSAPEDMPPFSEEAVRAANPAFDVFMNQQEVLDMMRAAERMPSRQSEFENLVLNRRVNLSNPFISRSVWESGAVEIDHSAFERGPVYVGLDLSARNDLTALVAVARGDDGVWNVRPEFFTPQIGLRERSHRDRVPYDVWVHDGLITATPGASVDYEVVARRLCEMCDDWPVVAVAFDRWRIDVLQSELSRMGVELPLHPFGQGFRDMSPALEALESELLNGRLHHGSNPVLRMCAANAIAVRDPSGNRKLDKSKPTGRIDGLVALAMAIGQAAKQSAPDAPPDYNVMFI